MRRGLFPGRRPTPATRALSGLQALPEGPGWSTLYYTVPTYSILYRSVLLNSILYYFILYCITLYCIVLYQPIPNYIALHYAILCIVLAQGISYGPLAGVLTFFKGLEIIRLRAPLLEVVCDGVITGIEGFRIRAWYRGPWDLLRIDEETIACNPLCNLKLNSRLLHAP